MLESDKSKIVNQLLEGLVADAQECFGVHLMSVTLFGSAAEDRLRETSDLNVIFIFERLDPDALERFAPKLAFARASMRVAAMFLMETEIPAATELFSVKVSDIHRRRKVLWGRDSFAGKKPSPEAAKRRLRQVLLNMTLRLRESFADRASQPERLAPAIAEFASPLRACAATVRELRAQSQLPPRESLEQFAFEQEKGPHRWLALITEARQNLPLKNEDAIAAMKALLSTAERMRTVVENL